MRQSRKQILWGRLKNFGWLTFLISSALAVSICALSANLNLVQISSGGEQEFVPIYDLQTSNNGNLPDTMVNLSLANSTILSSMAEILDDQGEGSSDAEWTMPCLRPMLSINKDGNSDYVQPGALLTYTITYSNVGNADAVDVIITDTLDSNVTFEWSSPISPTWSGSNVGYWRIDKLHIGEHGNINATVRVLTSAVSGTFLANLVQIDCPGGEIASDIETTAVINGNQGYYLPIITKSYFHDISPCDWDIHEPNNFRWSAHPISATTCITSHICSSNDKDDFYYMNVTVSSTITITLTGFAPDYDLYLYNSPIGQNIARSNIMGNGVPENITYPEEPGQGATPGTYYIRVYTLWEIQPVVPGSYRLCVTF